MIAARPAIVALVIMASAMIAMWHQRADLTAPDVAVGIIIFVVTPLALWLFDRQQEVARRRYAASQQDDDDSAEQL